MDKRIEQITLNVILITYKQEEYIRQTIESVLMQKTDFAFNIIVADDASPDNTLTIIKEYADSSDVEFLFLPEANNMGYTQNYKRAFAACTAPYIAIMEGDDYWISPRRLQHHVDFLNLHKEASMSFNRIVFYFQDTPDSFRIAPWILKEDFEKITTEQMIFGNKIGNLSACVFRRSVIESLNPEIFELNFADWLLGMACGQFGYIAHLKEPTSLYRVHPDGQWSRMSEKEQIVEQIRLLPIYNDYLNHKYEQVFESYEKYLRKVLTKNNKKISFRDFIPPILLKLRKYI